MNNDEKLLQLLNTSKCLSKKQMLNYRNGVLFPEELRAVELHLAECELCNFALEGFDHIKDPEQLINSLKMPVLPIQKEIEIKQEKKEIEKTPPRKVIDVKAEEAASSFNQAAHIKRNIYPEKRHSGQTILKIAGIAAILLIGFGLIWYFEFNNKKIDDSAIMAENDSNQDTNLAFVAPSDTMMKTISIPKKPKLIEVDSNEKEAKINRSTAVSDSNLNLKVIVPEPKPPVVVKKEEDKMLATENKEPEKGKDLAIAKKATKVAADSKDKDAILEPKTATKKASATPTKEEQKPVAEQTKKNPQQSDYEIGHSLFKKKQYASALLYLNTAASDKNDAHHWDAVYYSALCNKNMNNNRKAKKLLKQIIKNNAPQKSASEQQLEDIGGQDDE